jgi:demethylmenaquinone methyltransferase/2-methoxy-6-polyprenyl-1,4-benzoquinol methylase
MLDKSGATVQTMFSDIAGTYDLLNHVLSGNQDVLWRRRASSRLAPRRGELILDLCCGTGDSTIELQKRQPHCRVLGADFTQPMLALAQKKGLKELVGADALSLPFSDATFDAVTASFGVRNFSDTLTGLREMHRVLKPGGRIMILEFMRPTSVSLQKAFGASNILLAPLGRAISGHQSAYNYLPQSIGGFYTRQEFEKLLEQSGFENVRSFNHSLGIATSFLGRK